MRLITGRAAGATGRVGLGVGGGLGEGAPGVGVDEVTGAELLGTGWAGCPEAGWYHSSPAKTPPKAATISARTTSVVLPRERLTSDFR